MKKLIYSGVRPSDDNVFIDYTYNYPEDIIDIVEPQLYMSIHDNSVFHFGYAFNPDVDSKTRTEFIHSVKQIGEHPLIDDQLVQFIKRPLAYLDQVINLYEIDCMVYPLSKRSPLVSKIVRCINDMTSHDMRRCSFEFVCTAVNSPEADRFNRLQGDNILVVDDINTTGSTLNEILRKLGEINHDCNIYVYTLIGK